jgi:hypothetical protein
VQLSEADVSDKDQRLGRAEARVVRLGTETASIPSLHFLEEQVASLPAR